MKAIQSWEKSDSILANELPVIAMQSVKMKTITHKKKGIAGLFGKKEKIDISQRLEKQSNGNLCGQLTFTE